MNALFKPFIILAALSLLINACGGQNVHAEQADSVTAISYRVVLGKSLNDAEVADFIASNNCSPAAQYQLCKDVGISFWIDANQIVNMVFLYAGNAGDFRRYRGQLPFGLSFYDPKWRVEEKIRDLNSDDSLTLKETWQAGLPDEEGSPDHMHYWAMYRRFGMTVIYNTPGNDEDAYIYAIVLSQ